MTNRAHQCRIIGCETEATWDIWLTIVCKGLGMFRKRLKCKTPYHVCSKHTEHATKLISSPENRHRIDRWLVRENFPPADFELAEFEFTRVDHDAIDAALLVPAAGDD